METNRPYQYSIFKTRLGWFGILGCDKGLVRTCLPVAFKEACQRRLLSGIETAVPAKKAYRDLENDILSYYKGQPVDFSKVPVCLEGFTTFQQEVLAALRLVKHGKTVSYGELARRVKNPKASRAIGAVMAINPLPLIIPCHRVIKTDGSLGYFSAAGGIHTKQHMLDLEKS
jgi:methylated-DNA-[protein]-cysteine S-methyltransferase